MMFLRIIIYIVYPSQKRRKRFKSKFIHIQFKLFVGYSSKMNRGHCLRQGPKRKPLKPLLVNLSSDDEEAQFVQQIEPSGTGPTS